MSKSQEQARNTTHKQSKPEAVESGVNTKITPPNQPEAIQEKRRVFALGEKQYFTDSLDQENLNAIDQIDSIAKKIKNYEIDIRNARYAQQYLVDFLTKNVDKFAEVDMSKVTVETIQEPTVESTVVEDVNE